MNQPNPYQPPGSPNDALTEVRGDRAYLRAVATNQRGIMLCILASIGAVFLQLVLPGALRGVAVATGLLISLGSVYFVFQLARTVYSMTAAVIFAVLSFIPCAGLLALLVINQKATSVLRQAGLKVGLLGVDLTTLR